MAWIGLSGHVFLFSGFGVLLLLLMGLHQAAARRWFGRSISCGSPWVHLCSMSLQICALIGSEFHARFSLRALCFVSHVVSCPPVAGFDPGRCRELEGMSCRWALLKCKGESCNHSWMDLQSMQASILACILSLPKAQNMCDSIKQSFHTQ